MTLLCSPAPACPRSSGATCAEKEDVSMIHPQTRCPWPARHAAHLPPEVLFIADDACNAESLAGSLEGADHAVTTVASARASAGAGLGAEALG